MAEYFTMLYLSKYFLKYKWLFAIPKNKYIKFLLIARLFLQDLTGYHLIFLDENLLICEENLLSNIYFKKNYF